jgi:hypothetical protein
MKNDYISNTGSVLLILWIGLVLLKGTQFSAHN